MNVLSFFIAQGYLFLLLIFVALVLLLKKKASDTIEAEKWKKVKGYEGLYWISNRGRIKNRDKILKPFMTHEGYLQICLRASHRKDKKYYIHRLVAQAFVENPYPQVFKVVNHIDENRTNNDYRNLEWTTQMGNMHAGTVQRRLGYYWERKRWKRLKAYKT